MQILTETERLFLDAQLAAFRQKKSIKEKEYIGISTPRPDFNPQSATDIIIGNQSPTKTYRTAQALDIHVDNKRISSRDLKISINRADKTIRIFNTGNHTHLLRQNNQVNDLRHNTNISLSLNEPWSMRFSNTRIEIHNLPEQGRLVIGSTTDGEGNVVKPDASWVSVAEYEPVVKVEEPVPTNNKYMQALWQALSAPQS